MKYATTCNNSRLIAVDGRAIFSSWAARASQ
jgi:hypothetical protein